MNLYETGELLARIQVHDNRQIGAVTIEEWQHDLDGVAYTDALQAVRDHRKTSTDYLTAGHVIAGVKRIRTARLASLDTWIGQIDEAFDGGEGGVTKAALDARREAIRRVADGESPDDVVADMAGPAGKLVGPPANLALTVGRDGAVDVTAAFRTPPRR